MSIFTTENFIEKSRKIHDDEFGYEQTIYTGALDHVIIYCKKCDVYFDQRADSHLRGYKHKQCSNTKSEEQFIIDVKKIHGNRFDYTKSIYNRANKEIIVKCNSCKKDFTTTPQRLLEGHGCSYCLGRNKTNEEFINESKKLNGDKLDYTFCNYTDSNTKVLFLCKWCNNLFLQSPNNHLQGQSCPYCAGKNKNTHRFVIESQEIHENKYTYPNTIYISAHKHVEINCSIHGSFWQTPASHLSGHGCRNCSTSGFDFKLPGILYYLKDSTTGLYKIGITNGTVKSRFKSKMKEINLLQTWSFKIGRNAYKVEQALHKHFKKFNVINENFLAIGGKTEFFSKDVLHLD